MVGGAVTTVAMPEYSSSRCWGDLPKDMIDSVLGGLTLLADYDRFGAVCSTWRRASLDPINRNRRIESSLCSSSPLLLYPSDDDNGKSPEKKPWKFIKLSDLVRGNPFYTGGVGGGGMIRLPRLPYDEKPNDINKVMLSADPSLSPNDYMFFVVHGGSNEVLFIKPWDNKYKYWRWILRRGEYHPNTSLLHVDDLVFQKGLVYVVDQHEGFYVCDIFKEQFQLLCFAPPTPDGLPSLCYFVQSPDDDDELILVYMSIDDDDDDDDDDIVQSPVVGALHEFQFRVYKLLLAPGGPATWHEMKNLGSDSKSIILGRNHSVCIKTCHGGFKQTQFTFHGY